MGQTKRSDQEIDATMLAGRVERRLCIASSRRASLFSNASSRKVAKACEWTLEELLQLAISNRKGVPSTGIADLQLIREVEAEGRKHAGSPPDREPMRVGVPKPFSLGLVANPELLQLVPVHGDAMEELLRSGDLVLVDTGDKAIDMRTVFAVWGEDGSPLVRDVAPAGNRRMTCSARKGGHSFELPRENLIGRVVCRISRM